MISNYTISKELCTTAKFLNKIQQFFVADSFVIDRLYLDAEAALIRIVVEQVVVLTHLVHANVFKK